MNVLMLGRSGGTVSLRTPFRLQVGDWSKIRYRPFYKSREFPARFSLLIFVCLQRLFRGPSQASLMGKVSTQFLNGAIGED